MPGEKYPRFTFLILVIGAAVGLGNYWRFIESSQKFGMAFVIAYSVSLLLIALPLLALEFGLGARYKLDALRSFSRTKYLKNFGWFIWITGILIAAYYSILAAWNIIYFFVSFGMPWKSAPESYFSGNVLQISPYVWKVGTIALPVFIALLIGWVAIFFATRNGARTLKKSVIILIPAIVILMLAALIMALPINGSLEGISYFLELKLSSFFSLEMWKNALLEGFLSIGAALGIFITLSANAKKTAGYSLAAVISKLVFVTLLSLVVFSLIGISSGNAEIKKISLGNLGSQFILIPQAISLMPMPTLTSFMLFLSFAMISVLGAASIAHFLSASISNRFKIPYQKSAIIICGAGFIIGILFTTKSGYYFMDLLDHFVYRYSLLVIAVLECILAGWLYKSGQIESYLNKSRIKLGGVWKSLVRFFVPMALSALLAVLIIEDFTSLYKSYPLSAILAAGAFVVVPLAVVVLLSRE